MQTKDDRSFQLERKAIKHIYLSITPRGEIRLRVPQQMSDDQIEAFLAEKRGWIEKKLAQLPPVTEFHAQAGDKVALFGRQYSLLPVADELSQPLIRGEDLLIRQADREDLVAQIDSWRRLMLQAYLDRRLPVIADEMGVMPKEWRIRRMSTRWGSCNPGAGRIWLSLELARRAPELIDYVIVHELCHLIEPGHNQRFYDLMTRYLPDWAQLKQRLNQPLDG